MKKFCLLLSFLFLLLFTYSFKPIFNDIFKQNDLIFGSLEYSIYCLNAETSIEGCTVLNIGNGYIIKTDVNNASLAKRKTSNILGESVRFNSSFNKIEKIKNLYNIQIIKEEKLDGIYSLYGFTLNADFTNSIYVDNQLVNIQIAFNNGTMVIGTPIILGDY